MNRLNPGENNGDPMLDDPVVEWVCGECLGRMEHAPTCSRNPRDFQAEYIEYCEFERARRHQPLTYEQWIEAL